MPARVFIRREFQNPRGISLPLGKGPRTMGPLGPCTPNFYRRLKGCSPRKQGRTRRRFRKQGNFTDTIIGRIFYDREPVGNDCPKIEENHAKDFTDRSRRVYRMEDL